MGTRAVIFVAGSHWQGEAVPQTVRLYRHDDGGPDWTLQDIAAGIRAADRVRSAHVRRWEDPRYDYTPARTLADCVIAASIGWGGAQVRVDVDDPGDTKDTGRLAVYTQPLGPEHHGGQADLEWAYVVDIRRRAVTVYAGCGTVGELMAAGPQSPEVLLETIYEKYRPSIRRRIRAGVQALVSQGWAVNPASAPAQEWGAVRRT